MRVEDDVLRDEGQAEMMEWRWLFDLVQESSTTRGCCWGSGGGDEQGVMASSSSLKEALAVMERRPLLGSRCDSAILCGLIWMLLGRVDDCRISFPARVLNYLFLSCCYCVVMVDISLRATQISKRKDFLGVVSFLFMDRRVCRSRQRRSQMWVVECV